MSEDDIQEIIESEWTVLFNVEDLEDSQPKKMTLEPDEEERKRLSQRLGLLGIDKLVTELVITQQKGSMVVHITGKTVADVIQPCVVTLEPVPSHIEDEFESWYADSDAAISLSKKRREKESKGGNAEVRMLEEFDDPEPIVNGQIDLGELVSQYLSLAIEPYPHAEGVKFEVGDDEEKDVSQNPNNPFAALKDWKDKL